MSLSELAQTEAVLAALHKATGDQLKDVRADVQKALEETGASRVDATLPDGTKVATVSRSTPTAKATVTDEDKLLAWVREHAPGEIVSRVVTEIRPAYLASLLAQMTAAGAAEVADQATGELHGVPGVEMLTPRSTTHSTRHTKHGPEQIATAWRDGQLGHLDLPQLGAGGES